MIISDEDDAQKIKDPPVAIPTVRCPESAATRPFGLPDYETSQALAFRDFNDSQVTLCKPPPRRRFLDSRFWRAALISLVVYIFLTLVIGVPIVVHKVFETAEKYPLNALTYALAWPSPNNNPGPSPANSSPLDAIQIQPGIYAVCNNWTEVEYTEGGNGSFVLAMTENYVPANGQFSLHSNASVSNSPQGAFYTGINPNGTVRDAVLSIIMQSSSPSIFNQTFSCLAAADNITDLSLYVPDLTSPDSIQYNISLLFPQTAFPSRVDTFSTFLPLFDQRLGFFDDNVIFDKVSIEGPVSRVTVDSIQANRILVDTSLEPVIGTFQAQSSLVISTIMAPIVVNISLYNDPASQFATLLDVHTGNGNLTANVTVLAPNARPPLRPNFVANLRTFSGSLSTNLLHDPASPPAIIQLQVDNDLGPADVTLDSLFEGIYQVCTKQAHATVTQGKTTVPDPWNAQLERSMVVQTNSSARSFGWIGWGDVATPWEAHQQGEVLVDSSLADVTLTFLG